MQEGYAPAPENDNEIHSSDEKPYQNPNKEKLRQNTCLKISSIATGILFAAVTCYFLGAFTFGGWNLNDETNCFAVEYPDNT